MSLVLGKRRCRKGAGLLPPDNQGDVKGLSIMGLLVGEKKARKTHFCPGAGNRGTGANASIRGKRMTAKEEKGQKGGGGMKSGVFNRCE